MKALLIRANRDNLDLGDRDTKYLSWFGDVFDVPDSNTERAFAFIEVNTLDELLSLIDEFDTEIIVEKYYKSSYILDNFYEVDIDYTVKIYDGYIE